MPTIFTTMAKTPYTLTYQTGVVNTWADSIGETKTVSGYGVFKPRNNTSNPALDPSEVGEPTLNISPSVLTDGMSLKNLEGATVTVGTEDYSVTGVATGKNFRTGRIEHYRLELREVAQ